MAQLYLDENDRVRFDPTADGGLARNAAVNRTMLKMAEQLERLARCSIEVARWCGRSPELSLQALNQLALIKGDIRGGAATV